MAEEQILDGTQQTDPQPQQPFKVYNTQEEFDRDMANARKQGVKQGEKSAMSTIKDNNIDLDAIREQIKKELTPLVAKEAVEKYKKQQQMTEAERLEAERQEYMKSIQEREKAINIREAQAMLKEAGYSDEYIEFECSLITNDREASLGRIQRLCDLRKEEVAKMHKSIMDDLSKANPSIRIGSSDANSLQAQYDNAINSRNIAEQSRIIRLAQQQNITLRT